MRESSVNPVLVLLDGEALRSLHGDARRLVGRDGPTPILDGALPPSIVLSQALEQVAQGVSPFWVSCFLFLWGSPVQAVGSGGFKGPPVAGRVELGYGIASSHWGRGIATRAALELLDLAFTHASVVEVYAETALVNAASRRVVEKAGMRHIGRRDTQTPDDGVVDRWLISRAEHRCGTCAAVTSS